MPPICIKEEAFILNAKVDDAAVDVRAEESPGFFVVHCSSRRKIQRETHTINECVHHNTLQFLLKY